METPPSSLGSDLRQGVEDLATLAAADLAVVWDGVETPAEARAVLMEALPEATAAYGAAAATLAADWYDEQRDRARIGGRFRAIPAAISAQGAQALAGWATSTAVDAASLRTLVEGGLQRRIANASRETVAGSAVADPRARGWQRVGVGGCTSGFCDMLIARGAVYREATAAFAAHDHCKCSAVPAWGGQPIPVKPYAPTLRHISEEQRKRLRDYLATYHQPR